MVKHLFVIFYLWFVIFLYEGDLAAGYHAINISRRRNVQSTNSNRKQRL